MLEQEYQYYRAHEQELLKKYQGKFLGLVEEELVGVFDTEIEGYLALKKKYGLGKFLLQHCIPETSRIQRYHSRVAFR